MKWLSIFGQNYSHNPKVLPFPQLVCINVKYKYLQTCFMLKGLVSLEDLGSKEGYWQSGGAWVQSPENPYSVLRQRHQISTGPQHLVLKFCKYAVLPKIELV